VVSQGERPRLVTHMLAHGVCHRTLLVLGCHVPQKACKVPTSPGVAW